MTLSSRKGDWRADGLRCRLVALFMATAIAGAGLPALALAASAQVGFSPEGSAQVLVLDVINSAHAQLRVMAYAFTAPDIVDALVKAKKRGVDVQVVVDEKQTEQRAQRAALNVLATAGIPVRVNGHYQIMHDKLIVADQRTVQTGSFNYTRSGEHGNSENAVVLWDTPNYAAEFLRHWQSRWDEGVPFRASY